MKLTKEAIRQMAKRGEDVTQLDVRRLTDMSELFYDGDGWDEDGNYVSPLKDFNPSIS